MLKPIAVENSDVAFNWKELKCICGMIIYLSTEHISEQSFYNLMYKIRYADHLGKNSVGRTENQNFSSIN